MSRLLFLIFSIIFISTNLVFSQSPSIPLSLLSQQGSIDSLMKNNSKTKQLQYVESGTQQSQTNPFFFEEPLSPIEEHFNNIIDKELETNSAELLLEKDEIKSDINHEISSTYSLKPTRNTGINQYRTDAKQQSPAYLNPTLSHQSKLQKHPHNLSTHPHNQAPNSTRYHKPITNDSVNTDDYMQISEYGADDKDRKTSHQPIRQFGYDIFNQGPKIVEFTNIPVHSDYLLGPGDELVIRIWGKIEQKIQTVIDKKGEIYIPKVGHVNLIGVPFGQVNDVIQSELEKFYANIQSSTSMGQLKTIKVYILGHVQNPGAYDISSLSTAFLALYAAGGPSKEGTLRKILIKRNNKTVHTMDLYDYLLSGDASQDFELKNYDTIFVPPIGDVFSIQGVKKPAIFELNKSLSVKTAIQKYGGGFLPLTDSSSIFIQRLISTHTFEVIDAISHPPVKGSIFPNTLIKNGDRIMVSKTSLMAENSISIKGEVHSPKSISYKKNLTLNQAIKLANGPTSKADLKRIQIIKKNDDLSESLVVKTYPEDGSYVLSKNDIITVLTKIPYFVTIEGAVLAPGKYQFFNDMTSLELIKLAQIDPLGEATQFEIVRQSNQGYNEIIEMNMDDIRSNPKNDVILKPFDTVVIRYSHKKYDKNFITLSGAIRYPGRYYFSKHDTLASIIKRAGGFLDNADLFGANFKRQNTQKQFNTGYQQIIEQEKKSLFYDQLKLESLSNQNQQSYNQSINFFEEKQADMNGRVVIDLDAELSNDNSKPIKLESQDSLHIPFKTTSIAILGGVQSQSAISYDRNFSLKDYINQAGGYNKYAVKKNILVFRKNGIILRKPKTILPGDTIYVPEKIIIRKDPTTFISVITKGIVDMLTILRLVELSR